MLRVAEQFSHSDTGRQRRGNEDAFLERAPLFVVADGMGGAQAGEVASRIAIELFADGLNIDEAADPAERLAARAEEANAEIHARAQDDAELTGMGTTLTAAYVGTSEISFAHVGDSRAYRFHDGHLERLTHDHSLVEELIRQGQLTEAEAEEHPQRSIITRALGPEPDVDVDMITLEGIDGDVYLLCSDGLTSMVQENEIERIVAKSRTLDAAGRELIAAANKAGGRDNITVILFRLEDLDGRPTGQPPPARRRSRVDAGPPTEPLVAPAPVVTGVRDEMPGGPVAPQTLRDGYYTRPPRSPRGRRRIAPRMPVVGSTRSGRTRRRSRRFGAALAALAAVGVVALGLLLAAQAIYFIGADREGQVTIYNGLPFSLPFGINLYTEYFVSGVTTAELSPFERGRLFNNELRSQAGASSLVRALELDQVQGQ
ncbi:MAG: Stp1/IreP family PP2C-type Ser/Thr phosphatase [Solirubrobacteraceae bacterium]|jgi:protein phosphatase